MEKGETSRGQGEIQIAVLEGRCPALVNKLKRKWSFSCCGRTEKLENVKLTGSENAQPPTRIPNFPLCL